MASCSIKALSSADKRAYTAVAKRKGVTLKAARIARVEKLLDAAIAEHDALIAHVQGVYPGLINTEGVFLEDLRAQEFDAGQLELDLRAPVKKKAKAKEKKDGVRGKEKETKARAEKPSPAKVLKKGKAKGSEPAPKGEAKPTVAAAKDKTKAPRPKAPKEESQPAREKKPKQAERAEPVPPRVDKDEVFIATDEWQHFPKDAIAPAGVEFRLSLTDKDQREIRLIQPAKEEEPIPTRVAPAVEATVLPTAEVTAKAAPVEASSEVVAMVDIIETASGQEKADAIADLLHAALVEDTSGVVEDTSGALDLANRYDLLWDPANRELTIASFIEVLQTLYADKKNVTFKHQQAMWDFAIQHDMFRDAYIAVTSGGQGIEGFTPTNPKATMIAKLSERGIADVLISEDRTATDKLIHLLNKLFGYEEDLHFSGHTVDALKNANKMIDIHIKAGANLSKDFVPDTKLSAMLKDGKLAWLPFEGSKTLKVIATPKGFNSADIIVAEMDGPKGRTKIFDNRHKPITKPLSLGVVKPIVAKMMDKFNAKVRPKHRTYKNVAELQRKDPDIYQEAIDSRPDGNPIPAIAAGYAFGNRILIFSDNIGTRQELTFTVLHEVIGHFGLGSLMPTEDFHALLDEIYESDPMIRREADKLMGKTPSGLTRRSFLQGTASVVGTAAAGPLAKLNPIAKAILAARKIGIDFDAKIDADGNLLSFTPIRQILDGYFDYDATNQDYVKEYLNVDVAFDNKWDNTAFANEVEAEDHDWMLYEDHLEMWSPDSRVSKPVVNKAENAAIDKVYKAIANQGGFKGFTKSWVKITDSIKFLDAIRQETDLFSEQQEKFRQADKLKRGKKARTSRTTQYGEKTDIGRLERYEAIEEALADRAAELNNSIIQKIWNAIREFFRIIGFESNEDATRYFISQSLRYQRTGQVPDASAPAVYQNLKVLSERYIEGRASVPDSGERTAESTTNLHEQVLKKQKLGRARGLSARTFFERVQQTFERAIAQRSISPLLRGSWRGLKKAAEHIQTMNNLAIWSEGMEKLYRAFVDQAQEVSHLKTKYINATEFTNRVDSKVAKALGLQRDDVPSKEDLEQANRGLEIWLFGKLDITPEELEKLPGLTEYDTTGAKVLSEAGIKAVKNVGNMTREQINAGVQIPMLDDATGKPAIDKDGKLITEPLKPDAPLSENAWRIIEETRTAVDQAALDVHINHVNGVIKNQKHLLDRMDKDNKALTQADTRIIQEILAVYTKLYNGTSAHQAKLVDSDGKPVDEKAVLQGKGMKWQKDAKDRAKRFLHNTLRVLDSNGSNLKLQDWTGNFADEKDRKNMEEFVISTDPEIQAIIAKLPQLGKDKQGAKINGGKIQNIIANIHVTNSDLTNSELYAKHTIATAYVPLVRRGNYQVRVQAFDKDGNPLRLTDTLQAGLLYTRTNNFEEAEALAEELSAILAKSKAVDGVLDSDGTIQDGVTFQAINESALESAPLAGILDYSEIFHTLLRAGIELNAIDREKLIELVATQNSTARHNLRRQSVPGWDPQIHRGVREHLERQANIAAKNLFQHVISDTLTTDDSIWFGNQEEVTKSQAKFVAAVATDNEAAIFEAKRDMDQRQARLVQASGLKKIKTLSLDKDGNVITTFKEGRGLAQHYLSKATNMVGAYTAAHGMPAVTGDQLVGTVSSIFMTVTAAAHLGGALAPAAINVTSIITHAAPYLATYNPKTGYGGGHGMQAALQALFQAGSDLSLFKDGSQDRTGSAKAIQAIIDEGEDTLLSKYGLTMDEAEMLLDKTFKGVLTANITNVLTGTGNIGKGDSRAIKLMENWMFLFTKTEQYNRRVTALATYRLEKARMLVANEGSALTTKQQEQLSERVDAAVDFSQGNYEKFNHPSIAQGPMLRYLWIYKQFQAITIQLMRHLGHRERAQFLAFFILTAGLKGIPFEEDFADLVDTIMQRFGIDWNGLEGEMSEIFESLGIPAGLAMRGPIDYYLGITYSTRISQSNVIPGTGFFKAGAAKAREAADIIGPVLSAWDGVLNSAGTAGEYLLETVGLKPDVTTAGDVLRTGAGLSALKNYAKGITYFIDGTITNDRGQVVSHDAGLMTVLFQMMGFYPGAATAQYDVNRIGSDVAAYNKALVKGYTDAYNKTDRAGRRRIRRQVREWNKNVGRRSPLYISDFGDKVRRSSKAAKQSSVERSIKALPKSVKPFAKRIARGRGLDPRGLEIE